MTARSTFTFDVADIVKKITPVVIKNSSSSSTQAIAQRLHPDNFAETITSLVSLARSPFRGDDFAADLAQLNVLSSIRRQLVAVYSASFGDEDVARLLVEAFNSTESMAKIQGDERFSADIKPLHDRMKEEGAALNVVRKRLRAHLEPRVVPLAQASDWAELLKLLASAGRKKTKKDRLAALVALAEARSLKFSQDTALDLDATLVAFGKYADESIDVAAASFDVGNEDPSTDEAAILARAGDLKVAVMWQQFVNCLTRGTETSGIVDHRKATELAASRVALVDFSPSLENVDAMRGSYAMRGNGDGARGTTPWTEKEQVGVTLHTVPAPGVSFHSRALMFHVLSYAGFQLSVVNSNGEPEADKAGPTAALIVCSCAVPLSWHALRPLFDNRLKDLYKAFTAPDVQFEFIDYLLELVSKRRQGLLSIATERPKLERMLLDDIRKVISGVRESSQEGSDDQISDIVNDAASRLYSYEVRCVTPFSEGTGIIETSVEEFVATGAISMISTRPMGTFEIPKRYGRGFNEVVLRSDRHAFDAIVDSAPLVDVATAYNAVVRLDQIDDTNVGIIGKMNSWLSDALFDLSRNAVRESAGQAQPLLLASELFQGAAFKPMSDYVVVKSYEDKLHVMLEAGIDSVAGKFETWGNVHGSVTWGLLEGRLATLSTAYDRGVASSVVEALTQVVEAYVPRAIPVEHTDGGGITIHLQAENIPYSSRLREVDTAFVPLKVDTGVILQLAATATTDPSVNEIVDGRLLRELKRSDLQVMRTTVPVLQFIADYAADQIIASYSLPLVELMIASLTRPLTEAEHLTLRTPISRSSVKNMTAYIASTVHGVSRLFAAVLISSIMKSLTTKTAALGTTKP